MEKLPVFRHLLPEKQNGHPRDPLPGSRPPSLATGNWLLLLIPRYRAARSRLRRMDRGGRAYYLRVLLTFIPSLVIPAALGVIATLSLAYALPAQRGKDMLLVFSTLFLNLLYLLFRLLQPEKLVNPEAFSDFLAFIA